MARHRFCASVVFVLLLTAVTPALQQTQPSAPSAQPQASPQAEPAKTPIYESATVLKTITRLVVVDVVVTDHKDNPITDLKREDFTILEDGKEQRIAAFSFQQPNPARPAAATASKAEVKLPENVFSNVPHYESSGSLNVVLLDALNTTAPHQAYARQQMIKYLQKMPAGRPVAVYMLGTTLRLLQDFTTDPALLKEVIKKMKTGISPVLDNPAGGEGMQLLPPGAVDSGMVPADMLQTIMAFEQERVAFQTDMRVAYTLDALNAIGRSLAGFPGRKNLIWISEAFPLNIDPNVELTGTNSFAGTRNYGQRIAETEDMLVDAQVAIYSIDARGLEGFSVFDASNSGTDKFGRSLGRQGRMTNAINSEASDLQNAHATMQDMASRTGGKAFYNRNDLDTAMSRSMEDGSTYYTLAYYPDNKKWNGKYRKISIKVDRQVARLRHRQGYFAVDPAAYAEKSQNQQIEDFYRALSLDSPSATGLRFHAGVVHPSEKTNNRLLVNFGIDPHAISFEKQSDGLQHASLDCVVRVHGAKGNLIKTEASTINAQLKPETFAKVMQSVFPCQDYVDLAPGGYLLRLGVRDNRTGLIGTTVAPVTIAPSVNNSGDGNSPVSSTKSEEKKP